MKPEEVRAIRDQVGGTRAMAERLEITDRAVRYWCERGIRRRPVERMVKGLVDSGD